MSPFSFIHHSLLLIWEQISDAQAIGQDLGTQRMRNFSKCASMQSRKYESVKVCKCASMEVCKQAQVCNGTRMQLRKYATTKVCNCTSRQMWKYANVCKYASTQMRKYAIMKIQLQPGRMKLRGWPYYYVGAGVHCIDFCYHNLLLFFECHS